MDISQSRMQVAYVIVLIFSPVYFQAKQIAGRTKHKLPLGEDAQGQGQSSNQGQGQTVSPPAHQRVKHLSGSTATVSAGAHSPAHHSSLANTNMNNTNVTSMQSSPVLATGGAAPSSGGGGKQRFNSIVALRDAFNSGELRSYGSPVMTLKETIDQIHWNGEFSDTPNFEEFLSNSASPSPVASRAYQKQDSSTSVGSYGEDVAMATSSPDMHRVANSQVSRQQ